MKIDGDIYSLEFLDYLDHYVTKVNFFTILDLRIEELDSPNFVDFRMRVKQKNSVLNKLGRIRLFLAILLEHMYSNL